MYTLTLLDNTNTKVLDTTIPANLSFIDKLSAVNYAARHVDRSGFTVVTIDLNAFQVEYTNNSITSYYVVSDIIDIRTTQYANLIVMESPKFNGQRSVVSTDELDDICSQLQFNFINYSMVNPAKRQAVAALLISSIKPGLTTVSFADLSDPNTYADSVSLLALMKPLLVVV